jgi:hypothetical protein
MPVCTSREESTECGMSGTEYSARYLVGRSIMLSKHILPTERSLAIEIHQPNNDLEHVLARVPNEYPGRLKSRFHDNSGSERHCQICSNHITDTGSRVQMKQ